MKEEEKSKASEEAKVSKGAKVSEKAKASEKIRTSEKADESEKNKTKEKKRAKVSIYFILRLLVIISLIAQVFLREWGNVFLCIVTLVAFTLPNLIAKKYKIELPNVLESIVYLFIFASAILGEINNFYEKIPFWDTILHTLNGFICAGIGFSLVDVLNQNSKHINLSPLYVAIVAFCFSMTIGVIWEFYEFSCDQVARTDMQKDRIVTSISSIALNEKKENKPVKINNIDSTIIKTKDGNEYVINNGYLDLGLDDTMKDLFVNLIGAVVFSCIGYAYIKNRGKGGFASNFIPKVKRN